MQSPPNPPQPARTSRARRNAVISRSEDGTPVLPRGSRNQHADEIRLLLDTVLVRISLEGIPPGTDPANVDFAATLEPGGGDFFAQPRNNMGGGSTPPFFPQFSFSSWNPKLSKWLAAQFWKLTRSKTVFVLFAIAMLVFRAQALSSLAQRLLTKRIIFALGTSAMVAMTHVHLENKYRLLQLGQVGSCVVCYQNPKAMVFECGHLCCCEQCSRDIVKRQAPNCPLCRCSITQQPIKVYF